MVAKENLQRIWIDGERFFALATDGCHASYRLADWPRLAAATPQQREAYTLSFGVIHWPELDEVLSLNGLFRQIY